MYLPKKNRIKDNVVIITNRLINILCIKSEIKHAHGIILVWSKLRLLLVLVVDVVGPVVMVIISNIIIITVYYIFICGIHHFSCEDTQKHKQETCVYINHFLLLFHTEKEFSSQSQFDSLSCFHNNTFIYLFFIYPEHMCVKLAHRSQLFIYLFFVYPVDKIIFVFFLNLM